MVVGLFLSYNQDKNLTSAIVDQEPLKIEKDRSCAILIWYCYYNVLFSHKNYAFNTQK